MARILIVDDHDHVRGAARRVLEREGHEVWDVPEAEEALRLLDILRFHLVLTDICMAPMDGVEFLVCVRERGLRVPVVAMSGGGFASKEELLAMAKACGAAATIVKPFSPHELSDTVSAALRVVAA